jgi:L-rhamnonate dehydratase
MSRWEKYRTSRTSWGINVLGSFCVEIEASDGTVGFATGFGGRAILIPTPQSKAN